MVNKFKHTVVHVVRPNPMQICACAKKTVENQDWAAGLRAAGLPLATPYGVVTSKTETRIKTLKCCECILTARELLASSAMNATRTVAKTKLENNPLLFRLKNNGLFSSFVFAFAMIVSKNWFSIFVYVANWSFVLSVSAIWKIVQTSNQVNRRTTRNGVTQTKRLHWNTAENNVNMISTQSERHK